MEVVSEINATSREEFIGYPIGSTQRTDPPVSLFGVSGEVGLSTKPNNCTPRQECWLSLKLHPTRCLLRTNLHFGVLRPTTNYPFVLTIKLAIIDRQDWSIMRYKQSVLRQ